MDKKDVLISNNDDGHKVIFIPTEMKESPK